VGIQNAEDPVAEDLIPDFEELKISPGDLINVSIFELFMPGVWTERQIRVGNSGFETIPQIGPVRVVDLTPRGLELELKQRLREAEILEDADVQVSMMQSQRAKFSIVGNVTRAGVYPLPSPDYRLLTALASAGGIPALIEKIYVFQRVATEAIGDGVAGRGQMPEAGLGGGTVVPYTLSDVSVGAAAALNQEQRTSLPTTRGPASDGLDVLDHGAVPSYPRLQPEWDEERGEWVIKDVETQPVTGAAVETEIRPATRAEAPDTRRGELETQAAPLEEAEGAWEVPEELKPPMRIVEISVKELMEGDPRYNIVIRPNDLINVPAGVVGEFYMMGNIARPGAYALTGRRLTVKEAIASAGGFGALAWPARADLIRRLTNSEEQIIQLDLDAIFAGEAADFYVKPNDIVNVGTTPAAVFFAVLRNAFRFTYGMGFVYDRNFADSDTFAAREQVKNRRRLEAQQRGIPF
jgi:polysaccharide export outer membrane protein